MYAPSVRDRATFLASFSGLVNDGTVMVDNYGQVKYTYDMTKDNGFRRTIRGLSVEAEDNMYLCSSCPYSEFDKFYQYYGVFAYADHWVLSAFDGKVTEFQNGNADFRLYDDESCAGML
jgi:hypothetical protein